MRLEDKVAIVTGGASGIGAAISRRLASEGAAVLIADVLAVEGEDLAAEIAGLGGTAWAVLLDVTSAAHWSAIMALVEARFGRLDILVNNAGLTGGGYADPCDIDGFERLLAVNLKGAFLGVRAALPLFPASGGAVINIASSSTEFGTPGIHLAYNSSKGGLRSLTKSAAAEYGPRNIRVNSVHPGAMPGMRGSARPGKINVPESLLARVPLRRAGNPGEVAAAVAFLASEDASYITGAELYVDGGLSAS
jgi:NAD(P)-dependent dehydrogenase (short-subunit alcohol dehydrogenase family)